MNQAPAPRPTGPDPVESEFVENLRSAAFLFEKEKDGRFKGTISACRAVARFIYQRGGAAELAGPFLQIAEAFAELERGGKPTLFSKKSVPARARERSSERKHIHRLAAAALEVLIRLGPHVRGDVVKRREIAAIKVAQHVSKWPGMKAQDVTGKTIIAWRNQQRALVADERSRFDLIVEKMLAEQNPQQTVEDLLRKGPPGYPKN
jgi:hypothetical protein